MAIACAAQRLVIGARGDLHVGRAHGLHDHRGDVLFLGEHVFDVLGAARIAGPAAAEAARPRIARRHVLGPRKQRSHVAAEERLAADGNRVERRAVERVPHRDRLVPPGGEARELQRHADRARATGREENLGEVAGCELDQAAGERDRGLVREAPGRERERVERAPDRLHDAWVPVADLVDAVAVKIHVAPALDVLEPDAGRGGERVEARRRKRLVQEVLRVLGEQRPRRGREPGFPSLAQGRQVHVTLGREIGARRSGPPAIGRHRASRSNTS